MTQPAGATRRLEAIGGGAMLRTARPVAAALRTLDLEADGLIALKCALQNGLADPFAHAVELLKRKEI